jgi:hypothetical protein
MSALLRKIWIPLVVVVAIALGSVAVNQLRGLFGSDDIFFATGTSAEPLSPSHMKRVVYEVDGPTGTSGAVSYLDALARPVQADFTSLPWTYTVSTTVPAVIANVVAQGDSDRITCRITVDGAVKDEQASEGHHAQASCLVKAA